jgi:hypothetical protein
VRFPKSPFRLTNLVVVALILGILVGLWLGDLFKGLGWGPGEGGTSRATATQEHASVTDAGTEGDLVGFRDEGEETQSTTPKPSGLVRVLIDDRSYFVRDGEAKTSIALDALVRRIAETEPNEDGLQAIIDRTSASRVVTERNLRDALRKAGVAENSVYWTPHAVE